MEVALQCGVEDRVSEDLGDFGVEEEEEEANNAESSKEPLQGAHGSFLSFPFLSFPFLSFTPFPTP